MLKFCPVAFFILNIKLESTRRFNTRLTCWSLCERLATIFYFKETKSHRRVQLSEWCTT